MNSSIIFCEFTEGNPNPKSSTTTTCECSIQNLVIIFYMYGVVKYILYCQIMEEKYFLR